MLKLYLSLAVATAMAVSSGLARADDRDDAAVRNRVTCYPFGIDKIGRGDSQGGLAVWKDCFAPNFSFSVFIGPESRPSALARAARFRKI